MTHSLACRGNISCFMSWGFVNIDYVWVGRELKSRLDSVLDFPKMQIRELPTGLHRLWLTVKRRPRERHLSWGDTRCLLCLAARSHNLNGRGCEYPGSGTDSWHEGVIWNQKRVVEKTYSFKGRTRSSSAKNSANHQVCMVSSRGLHSYQYAGKIKIVSC